MIDPQLSLFMTTGDSLLDAGAMLLVFIGVLFVGSALIPAAQISGPSSDGESRSYRLNGLALFLATLILAGLGQVSGWFTLSVLYDHFFALFITANVFAFALSFWLYFQANRTVAESSGFLHGFFFGRDANPTWFGVDLKFFSYRPSLIGLALFNASFAVVQYETYGTLSLAMILYQAFTIIYVFSYFQFERGMVHTWDMISERFGWMLVWGDYVLVPFFYSLIGWWLIHPSKALHPITAVLIVLLFVFGFWVFRGANQQKHRFKRNPNIKIWGKPARSLEGRLLISGFWGIGRHLNYTGEICVYFAFALTAGFDSWIPYLLPAWLTVLLFHRSRRDEYRCRTKYGALWERYTQRVRFSMLPFVY